MRSQHARSNAQTRVERAIKPPSRTQIDYIKDLALKKGVLDQTNLKPASMAEASRTISYLKRQRDAVNPQAPGFQIDYRMVNMIKSGRYAVRADDQAPYVFLRVSRPTTGRQKGYLKIQTKHSENLITRLLFDKTGRLESHKTGRVQGQTLQELLTLVMLDQAEASFNYAQELEQCGYCGRDLTDKRSRWLGIGPECEKKLGAQHILNYALEKKGEYVGQ
jgi:hypothetical protein